jgi:hypothetical protein
MSRIVPRVAASSSPKAVVSPLAWDDRFKTPLVDVRTNICGSDKLPADHAASRWYNGWAGRKDGRVCQRQTLNHIGVEVDEVDDLDVIALETTRVNRSADVLERAVFGGAYAGPISASQIVLGCALGWIDPRHPVWRWRDKRPALAAWFSDETIVRANGAVTTLIAFPCSDAAADRLHRGPDIRVPGDTTTPHQAAAVASAGDPVFAPRFPADANSDGTPNQNGTRWTLRDGVSTLFQTQKKIKKRGKECQMRQC